MMNNFFKNSNKKFSLLLLVFTLFISGCMPTEPTTTTSSKQTTSVQSSLVSNPEDRLNQEKKYLTEKFSDLKLTNKDTVGYIYVPGGNMSEEIVQDKTDKSNSVYLDKTFEGQHAPLMGAVFMDYRNTADFNDRLTWLFGHARGESVRDHRMFKDVLAYTDQKFFDEHPYVVVETPEGTKYYEALMIHEVHESTELYKTDADFSEDNKEAEFEEYFKKLSQSTTIKAKKDDLVLNPRDKYLILSTCPDFIADPETRWNLYLRQIPDSEINDFLEKNKDKLTYTARAE